MDDYGLESRDKGAEVGVSSFNKNRDTEGVSL